MAEPKRAEDDERKRAVEDERRRAEMFVSQTGGFAYYANKSEGELDRAIGWFSVLIGLKPDDADAYHNRGFAYWTKGECDKAIADFTEAIRLKPDFADAYFCRSVEYGVKGESGKSTADWQKGKQLQRLKRSVFRRTEP